MGQVQNLNGKGIAMSEKIEYKRDALGNILEKWVDGVLVEQNWYNEMGLIYCHVDDKHRIEYHYDAERNVIKTQEFYPRDNKAGVLVITSTFSAEGSLLSRDRENHDMPPEGNLGILIEAA